MSNLSNIIALTNALSAATAEVGRLNGRVEKLKAIQTKLSKNSTKIAYIVTLSELIAGDKYDAEEKQEKADLGSLEKILSTKKNEILKLLNSKITQVEEELATARLSETNARNALNVALQS
jgi:hypothetical protein